MREISNMLPLSKSKGGIMPKFHNLQVFGVPLNVRPIGRRRFFRFWPYWVGDQVEFRIELKNKGKKQNPLGYLAIYEDIPIPDSSKRERYPLLTEPWAGALGSEPPYLNIKGHLIAIGGSGRYCIGHPDEPTSKEIITFTARPDETLTMWLFGAFIGIAGAIIGAIITGFVLGRL